MPWWNVVDGIIWCIIIWFGCFIIWGVYEGCADLIKREKKIGGGLLTLVFKIPWPCYSGLGSLIMSRDAR